MALDDGKPEKSKNAGQEMKNTESPEKIRNSWDGAEDRSSQRGRRTSTTSIPIRSKSLQGPEPRTSLSPPAVEPEKIAERSVPRPRRPRRGRAKKKAPKIERLMRRGSWERVVTELHVLRDAALRPRSRHSASIGTRSRNSVGTSTGYGSGGSFSLAALDTRDRGRQRQAILSYLERDNMSPGARRSSPSSRGTSHRAVLTSGAVGERLLKLADEYQSERTFKFNRFERLSILDVLIAQHKLMKLDEEISFSTVDDEAESLRDLRSSLKDYVDAIESFEKLSSLKPSTFETSDLTARLLARELQEPRYFDSPDALNLCDLTPPQATHSIDGLRLYLQRLLPVGLLDNAGRERREIDEAAEGLAEPSRPPGADEDLEASASGSIQDSPSRPTRWFGTLLESLKKEKKKRESGETYSRKGKEREGPQQLPRHILDIIGPNEARKIIESYHHRPYTVSPVIDITARLLVALIGGLLVLIPMTVLSYITAFKWVLVVAYLFTICFSVALSTVSRASNDQIIAATAAYGAVLVVFVANILSKSRT